MKRSQAEIIEDIKDVYCALSPENLSCDGELPMYLQRKRFTQYRKRLHTLFDELGREVSEEEAYGLVR